MYRLETTPDFEKDFKSLERDNANRVVKKLEWLSQNPEVLRFPLKHAPRDLKGLQKYRVGDYRILFWVDHNKKAIILHAYPVDTGWCFGGMILRMSDHPRTLLEFQHLFPDETACARHLERIRPEGFECPSCGQVGDPWRLQARPCVLECRPSVRR